MILRFYMKAEFIFFAMAQSASMKPRQGVAQDACSLLNLTLAQLSSV